MGSPAQRAFLSGLTNDLYADRHDCNCRADFCVFIEIEVMGAQQSVFDIGQHQDVIAAAIGTTAATASMLSGKSDRRRKKSVGEVIGKLIIAAIFSFIAAHVCAALQLDVSYAAGIACFIGWVNSELFDFAWGLIKRYARKKTDDQG